MCVCVCVRGSSKVQRLSATKGDASALGEHLSAMRHALAAAIEDGLLDDRDPQDEDPPPGQPSAALPD